MKGTRCADMVLRKGPLEPQTTLGGTESEGERGPKALEVKQLGCFWALRTWKSIGDPKLELTITMTTAPKLLC